jgi:hypothetical protein
MTLKNPLTRSTLNASLLLAVLLSFFFQPIPVEARSNNDPALPGFADFSQTVQSGEADVLRGVYVPNVLALPVVQQPAGSPGYVSNQNGQATQFSMAATFGNVGLLAHNTLSGRSFSQLAVGQEVRLIYGGGKVEYFVITEILQYQALQPTSQWGEFRDLAGTGGKTITAEQLFKRVYSGARHVTFQTCIEAEGNASWGRLFVLATPIVRYSNYNHPGR